MTTLKNSVYVLIAVVAGVMLVGMIPGQLSSIAAPTLTGFQNTSKEATGNLTLSGVSPLRQNDTTSLKTDSTTLTSTDDITKDWFTLSETSQDTSGDIKYYSIWGIGLIVALTVYVLAKRML